MVNLKRIWKEMVVSWYLPEGTEETVKNLF
jgi:hypothetical protein